MKTLGTVARLGGAVLVMGAFLSGCGGGGGSGSVITPPPPTAAWQLRATNDSGLTAWFRDALGPSGSRSLDTGGIVTTATASGAVSVPAPAAPTAVFSATTLQEAGVDEADLIKSDGVSVFSLDPNPSGSGREMLRRQRLDAAAPGAALGASDTLKLPFSGNVQGAGLYLDSERKQLAAIGRGVTSWGIYDAWFSPPSWGQGATEVVLVDTSSAAQMQTRRTLRITAQLIGSRRIGSTLYLVVRSYPQLAGFDPSWPPTKTASNQAILNSLQPQQLLPTLSVNGDAPQPLVDPASCLLQDQNATRSADIITVMGIDLAASTERHAARCFVGGTEAFYMSQQNLYLATTRTAYSYSGGLPFYAGQSSTDIHKFGLNGLDIVYRGSGNVQGHLGFDQNRKSFRMGEQGDALRVVTQTQQSWVVIPIVPMLPPVAGGGSGSTGSGTTTATGTSTTTVTALDSPAHLTVLQERDGALAMVGELPNATRPEPLGKAGEQLYASRFLGNRGYIVTYRLTDPLYVLDLSNPADPKVAGQLQVQGYSDYLFPLTENVLLGVGKDAQSDGTTGDGRFAWYQGVKVSLIDVSNPALPREAARSIIGRRGTSATVLTDSHGIALLTQGNTVRVSLPVNLHDTPVPGSKGQPSDYFQFTRTELQRFQIDVASLGLAALTPITASVAGDRDITQDRSLLWNDQVHWYQNGIWRSAGW